MTQIHHRSSPRRVALALAAPLALAVAATAGTAAATTEPDEEEMAATTEAAAEEGLLAELQEAGTVTVGIANEPPFGYEDQEGNVTGEAPELARAVLTELGIEEIEAVAVEFGALIPGLEAGQYDMIAAGMFITPERAEQIIFSDPDYCITNSFAVEEGNPFGITDYVSVAESDAILAIVPGTTSEDYAAIGGVPEDQLEPFGDIVTQYDALAAGRVDVVPGNRITVEDQVAVMEGFEATEPFFPVDEEGNEILQCGAFGFLDQGFRDAFNDVLNELKEDGTVAEIITEFGFTEEEVELALEQTVESVLGEEEAAVTETTEAADGDEVTETTGEEVDEEVTETTAGDE
jgi:polar amino acid transport system substrate-binding protein